MHNLIIYLYNAKLLNLDFICLFIYFEFDEIFRVSFLQ